MSNKISQLSRSRQVGRWFFLNGIQPTDASHGPIEGTAVDQGREDRAGRRQLQLQRTENISAHFLSGLERTGEALIFASQPQTHPVRGRWIKLSRSALAPMAAEEAGRILAWGTAGPMVSEVGRWGDAGRCPEAIRGWDFQACPHGCPAAVSARQSDLPGLLDTLMPLCQGLRGWKRCRSQSRFFLTTTFLSEAFHWFKWLSITE